MHETLTGELETTIQSAAIPRVLEEFGALLESPAVPPTFVAEFLNRLLATLPIAGAAVWTRGTTADQLFRLEHAVNWSELKLETHPDGLECHARILDVASERTRALWIGPKSGSKLTADHGQAANRSDHGLICAPIHLEGDVIGILEVWLSPIPESAQRRELARQLTEFAATLATYFRRHRGLTAVHDQKRQRHMDAFVLQAHSSLDPKVVAQWIAQEGRCIVECDQFHVAIQTNETTRLTAVSGAAVVEPNSRLVERMRLLAESVIQWGEPLLYQGARDDTLPPAVLEALDGYLAESNSRVLIVLPLQHPTTEGKPGKTFAVLAAESFEPTASADSMEPRLRSLVPHATNALINAIELERLPLRHVSRFLARIRDWASTHRTRRLGLYATPVVLALAFVTIVPMTLRLEAKGQLLPIQRQMVYAAHTGKIVEMRAHPGDRVEKGQELLFIEDLETQLQIDQLAIKIGAAEQRLALVGEQLAKVTGNEERTALAKERIQQQYELRKATVERDILLQTSRSPRKAPVVAPLAGKVVTFDAQEQLLGKTVRTGDPLVRIAGVKGTWEIELMIPERNVGPIREGLQSSDTGYVDVDLLLASQPHRTYKARLYRDGLAGEAKVVDSAVVLPARVRLADDDLMQFVESLPVGLEVRTKVHCGKRSILSVWFHDLGEYFYEHVVF